MNPVRLGNVEEVPDYFVGSLDEVRIFNGAFGPKEIWTLYGGHLIAFFPLNEGSGTLTCDASLRPIPGNTPRLGSQLCDASGNGHAGTVNGGASWTPGADGDTGKLGYAMSFNGLGNYVEIAHDTALNAYPMTFAAWIKTSSGAGGIVSKMAGPGAAGWNVEVDSSGSVCATYMKDASNGVNRFCGAAVRDNKWHHVVFLVDLGGGSLYVDGAPSASQPWSGTAGATTSTDPLLLGRDTLAFFAGLLDDVRIHGRALTSDEVSALYQRAANP